jgi:hypothetical protein
MSIVLSLECEPNDQEGEPYSAEDTLEITELSEHDHLDNDPSCEQYALQNNQPGVVLPLKGGPEQGDHGEYSVCDKQDNTGNQEIFKRGMLKIGDRNIEITAGWILDKTPAAEDGTRAIEQEEKTGKYPQDFHGNEK